MCMDIPRSGPVPVCPNGHFVCQACKADFCPTCRIKMGNGKSLLASTLLDNIDHHCKFNNCDMVLASDEIENHEGICPNRDVICPHPTCSEKVSLSELVDHIKQSCGIGAVQPLQVTWNRRACHYSQRDTGPAVAFGQWALPVRMYTGFGQIFGTYVFYKDNHFFFGLTMFAAETECSKFKVEMVVHEKEADVEDSDMNVKFQDSPMSIDVSEKKKMRVLGISLEFMLKLA